MSLMMTTTMMKITMMRRMMIEQIRRNGSNEWKSSLKEKSVDGQIELRRLVKMNTDNCSKAN